MFALLSGACFVSTAMATEALPIVQEKGVTSTELQNLNNITQQGNWAASRYLQRITKADTVWSGSANESVSYSNNTVTNQESTGSRAGVLAIDSDNYYKAENVPSLTIQGYGDVSFDDNTLSSKQLNNGGAIYIIGDNRYEHAQASLNVNNNSTVSFDGNSATATNSNGYGGALYMGQHSAVELEGNDKVSFNNNSTTTAGNYASGGAIYLTGDAKGPTHLSISSNTDVSFIGNTAKTSNTFGKGGAIYSGANTGVAIEGNTGKVEFIGNGVQASSSAKGGAIYNDGSTLSISGNKEVVFAGNYEKNGSDYLLRSIYSNSGEVKLSAAANGTMEFRDSVYIKGNVNLNESYNDTAQTGTIIFTGRTVESDLNRIIADHTAEGETIRTATDQEIANSLTSTITGSVKLTNGILSLQDGVKLNISGGLTIAEGANLEVKLSSDPEMIATFGLEEAAVAATLNANLILEDNTTFTLDGGLVDMADKNITLGDGVTINVLNMDTNGEDMVTLFRNIKTLTLSGSVVNDETITLNINGVEQIATYDAETGSIMVSARAIPEPTTATLSLLALAALAARRRRR